MEGGCELHAPASSISRYPFDRLDGPQIRLDAVAKRKSPCPYRESKPVVQPVA
jgi:hypothetical protein